MEHFTEAHDGVEGTPGNGDESRGAARRCAANVAKQCSKGHGCWIRQTDRYRGWRAVGKGEEPTSEVVFVNRELMGRCANEGDDGQ